MTDSHIPDHDLLIKAITILETLQLSIPSKCERHDTCIATALADAENTKARVDKLEDTTTWAFRLAIGSCITLGIGLIALFFKFVIPALGG